MLASERVLPRVSLCMIVKDEEKFLSDCLSSASDIVHELIIVDTGSTDRTQAIARAAGALVIEQPWRDDFAFHRNESIARATGDWILVLDADERLAPAAKLSIRSAIKEDDFDVGLLRCSDASRLDASVEEVLAGRARLRLPVPVPRLLRRTPELEYRGIVHEDVSDWAIKGERRQRFLDADIIHFGSVPELRAARAKSRRNIDLLEKRCALEHDDHTAYGYLAGEYLGCARMDDARRVAEAGWEIVQAARPRKRVLRLAVARASVQLAARDGEAALQTVELAEQLEGQHPDTEVIRGMALELLADTATGAARRALLERARAAHARAAASTAEYAFEQYVQGSSSWFAWARLGTVEILLGRPKDALDAFERSLQAAPHYFLARLGVVEARMMLSPAHALALVEPLLGDSADAWLLAASCALALGQREDARALFARAEQTAKAGYLAPHRRHRHAELAAALTHTP